MRFTLCNGDTEIGQALFHGSDPPMGCALFHLLPNEHYLALQPVLQSATMMRLNHNVSPEAANKIAALDLTIRDEEGMILAAQGITVDDARAEMPEEPIHVWLLGVDRFEHYFPGEYEHYEAYFMNRRQR